MTPDAPQNTSPNTPNALTPSSAPNPDTKPKGAFSTTKVRVVGVLAIATLMAYLSFIPQKPRKKVAAEQEQAKQNIARTAATVTQTAVARDYSSQLDKTISADALSASEHTQRFGAPPPRFAEETDSSLDDIDNEPAVETGSKDSRRQRNRQAEVEEAILAEIQKREADSMFSGLIVHTARSTDPPAMAEAPTTPAVSPSPVPPAGTAPPAPSPTAASSAAPAQATDIAEDTPRRSRNTAAQNALNAAVGPAHKLFEGTVIEAVLTNRLNGTFTGPVNCMVTTDVWSHNRQHLLIPRGTRALGEARRVSATGQQRLAVSFHRLLMPDGYSVPLDTFTGMSQIGETGLKDKVDNHYRQIFGVSIALAAIAGFTTRGMSYNSNDTGEAWRSGFSQNLSQEATRILDRYLNILPTIIIREGTRVKIYLTDDLSLPAYSGHRMSSDL